MKRGPGPRRKTGLRSKGRLRSGKGLRSKGGLRSKKRINPRNAKRRPKEWARAYGSKERVKAIKRLPCHNCRRRRAENAHLRTGGTGRKGPWWEIVDLCDECHRTGPSSLHNLGSVEAFDAHHGTDLWARARFLAETMPPDSPHLGMDLIE